MRDILAVIDVLTIPTDAGPGDQRIVINGLNGTIELYDVNGDLFGLIDPVTGFSVFDPASNLNEIRIDIDSSNNPVISFFSDDAAEDLGGQIFSYIDGAGGTRNKVLRLESGRLTGGSGTHPFIEVRSVSQDGSEDSEIILRSGALIARFSDTATIPDTVIPRGVVRQFTSNTDGAVFTGDSVTDMVLNNVPVIAGDLYKIHLHTLVDFSAAAGQWNLMCRINGVNLNRFERLEPAVDQFPSVDSTLFWTPSTTQATDDISVFADEIIAGADLQLRGSANDLVRTLTLEHVGSL